MENTMDTAYAIGQMEESTRENGRMVWLMVREWNGMPGGSLFMKDFGTRMHPFRTKRYFPNLPAFEGKHQQDKPPSNMNPWSPSSIESFGMPEVDRGPSGACSSVTCHMV
jgi:hypothetical protein